MLNQEKKLQLRINKIPRLNKKPEDIMVCGRLIAQLDDSMSSGVQVHFIFFCSIILSMVSCAQLTVFMGSNGIRVAGVISKYDILSNSCLLPSIPFHQ